MPIELTTDQNTLIERLLSNKAEFEAFIYTPWKEALQILDERQNDSAIDSCIKNILPGGVPHVMEEGKRSIVLGRHIATPNFEMHRFMMCADVLPNVKPIIFEYLSDAYTDSNPFKTSVSKLCFYRASYDGKIPDLEYRSVVDTNSLHGTQLGDIKTKWGESLVDFHHTLFTETFAHKDVCFFDSSSWLADNGFFAKKYYPPYLSLFLKNNILFENFIFTKHEKTFIRNVVLPAFIKILAYTGKKPLIVALEPTDVEEDIFWFSYPPVKKDFIDIHIKNKTI